MQVELLPLRFIMKVTQKQLVEAGTDTTTHVRPLLLQAPLPSVNSPVLTSCHCPASCVAFLFFLSDPPEIRKGLHKGHAKAGMCRSSGHGLGVAGLSPGRAPSPHSRGEIPSRPRTRGSPAIWFGKGTVCIQADTRGAPRCVPGPSCDLRFRRAWRD